MEDWITSPPPKKKNVAHVPIPRIWVDYFLGGPVVKSACQRRRHRRHIFDPSVGKIPWRRKWQPIPVFLLGKSHGWRSPWDCKELDVTEHTCMQMWCAKISCNRMIIAHIRRTKNVWTWQSLSLVCFSTISWQTVRCTVFPVILLSASCQWISLRCGLTLP